LFVANGKKIEEFKALVEKEGLTKKTLFLPFLSPWQIPSVLKSCNCLVGLENHSSPVLSYHVPVTPAEAMATGRCTLLSNEIYKKEPYVNLQNHKELFVVETTNASKVNEKPFHHGRYWS
jgi:hypothetical protein